MSIRETCPAQSPTIGSGSAVEGLVRTPFCYEWHEFFTETFLCQTLLVTPHSWQYPHGVSECRTGTLLEYAQAAELEARQPHDKMVAGAVAWQPGVSEWAPVASANY